MPALSQHRSALQSDTSTCILLGHHGSTMVSSLDLFGHREVLTKDRGVFWNVKGRQHLGRPSYSKWNMNALFPSALENLPWVFHILFF